MFPAYRPHRTAAAVPMEGEVMPYLGWAIIPAQSDNLLRCRRLPPPFF